MKRHAHAPNGVFAKDLMLYGSMERGATAVRGFWIEPSDLRGASHERRNAMQEKVRAALALITPGHSMQVQWWTDPNYSPEILAFDKKTHGIQTVAVRQARNERTSRYLRRMMARQLRRDRFVIHISIEIEAYSGNAATRTSLRAHYEKLLCQLQAQFDELASALRVIFGTEAVVRPMEDAEHRRRNHAGERITAACRAHRHDGRGQIRIRLRPPFADSRVLCLHGHH